VTAVVGGGTGAIYVAGVVDLLDEWRVFHEGQCVLQVVKGERAVGVLWSLWSIGNRLTNRVHNGSMMHLLVLIQHQ